MEGPEIPHGESVRNAIAAIDWTKTSLGPRSEWPPHLQFVVELVLDAGVPMALVWGPEYTFLYNDSYTEIIQDKHPAALGASARDIFSEIWKTVHPLFEQVRVGNSVVMEDMELPLLRRNQIRSAYFSFSFSPIRSPQGKIDGFLAVVSETTKRVEAQQELAGVFESILSAIDELAYTLDRNLRFHHVNKALLDVWGLSLEQAVGKSLQELGHPPDVTARFNSHVLRVFAEKKPVRDRTLYPSPDGVERIFEYSLRPVLARDGSVSLVVGTSREVTPLVYR